MNKNEKVQNTLVKNLVYIYIFMKILLFQFYLLLIIREIFLPFGNNYIEIIL